MSALLFIPCFVLLQMPCFASDTYLSYFAITTNQDAAIRDKLTLYDGGVVGLEDLNENAGAEGSRELVGYYLSHTNKIAVKDMLPIGRAFAGFNMFTNAIKLALPYVKANPNDWHGWRLLAASYDSINASNESLSAYAQAVKCGDTKSYEPLAGVALKSGRVDVVRKIVPQLMALRDNKLTPEESRLNVISLLAAYSMMADQKEVFIKTLKGENIGMIVQNDDVRQNVMAGCVFFHGADIDKIRMEVNAGSASDSGSAATNAPSP
ncbi:MAG TPA: hypothetical protein VNX46_11295 [Candidatus Acidoferrum sp.]|nr:hypothetical protein [Candidatus Acidoferrum sp.]